MKRQRLATKVTAIDLTDPSTVSCCKGVVERKRETKNDSTTQSLQSNQPYTQQLQRTQSFQSSQTCTITQQLQPTQSFQFTQRNTQPYQSTQSLQFSQPRTQQLQPTQPLQSVSTGFLERVVVRQSESKTVSYSKTNLFFHLGD